MQIDHGITFKLGRLWKFGPSRENGVVISGQTGVMDGKQLGFSNYERTTAKKQATREKFLAEMEVI